MTFAEQLQVRLLRHRDVVSAAALCAQAMLDNPTHIRAFGSDRRCRQRQLQRFFPPLLDWVQRRGVLLGAFDGDQAVGILGLLPPDACRPRRLDLLRLAPALLAARSLRGTMRVQRWLRLWAAHDPTAAHWHLGPLAVQPWCQGRGVGSRLLLECTRRVDAAGGMLHLETDTPENVRFYERRGFVVGSTLQVLDVPNWLLQRPPRPPARVD